MLAGPCEASVMPQSNGLSTTAFPTIRLSCVAPVSSLKRIPPEFRVTRLSDTSAWSPPSDEFPLRNRIPHWFQTPECRDTFHSSYLTLCRYAPPGSLPESRSTHWRPGCLQNWRSQSEIRSPSHQ